MAINSHRPLQQFDTMIDKVGLPYPIEEDKLEQTMSRERAVNGAKGNMDTYMKMIFQ
jgi:hypothetical protein